MWSAPRSDPSDQRRPSGTLRGAFWFGGVGPAGTLPDLARDKSGRACLPVAGAFPRQPSQARPDFQPSVLRLAPCPAACAFGQSSRAVCHWQTAVAGRHAKGRGTPRPFAAFGCAQIFFSRITTSTRLTSVPSGAFGTRTSSSSSTGASEIRFSPSQKKCGWSSMRVSK